MAADAVPPIRTLGVRGTTGPLADGAFHSEPLILVSLRHLPPGEAAKSDHRNRRQNQRTVRRHSSHRALPLSEVEVESQQNTAAGQVGTVRRPSALTDPGVLVVPGEARATVHEGHVAVSKHIIINVPQIGGRTGNPLLRHSDPLRTLNENELGTVDVMSLDKCSIPDRRARAGRECIVSCGTGGEVCVVRAVLGYDLKVQFLQIKNSGKPFATEGLVPEPTARDWCPSRGQKTCRHLSNHGIEADALGPKAAHIEGLTPRKEPTIGIAVEQVDVAIARAEQCGGNSRAVVRRMAHPFQSKLVVADLPEDVVVPHRNEVIELETTATRREGQPAFL